MDLGLKGKVALVTGAGSQTGFGKGIALALAQEGCDIVATDKDLEGAKQTAAEVEALGCKAIAIKADVTKRTEVDDMAKAALAKFGKIDILVNNAGAGSGLHPFVTSPEANWERDTNINYRGVLYCTQAVLPQMLERKYGKIVNIASVAALVAEPIGISTYSAAKAAVLHFSKVLAEEVGPSGVNVNVIAPDMGDTAFMSNASPEIKGFVKEMAAAGKTATPQDIGSAVAYLVSDVARKVNGQFIKMGLVVKA